jgi:hypothetical protein
MLPPGVEEAGIHVIEVIQFYDRPDIPAGHRTIRPESPSAWQRWQDRLQGLIESAKAIEERQAPKPALQEEKKPQNGQSVQPGESVEEFIGRIALAAGDEVTERIMVIASNPNLSGEDKMIQILSLDPRFNHWKSTRWAKLLAVSPAAVRGYDTWNRLRQLNQLRDEQERERKADLEAMQKRKRT